VSRTATPLLIGSEVYRGSTYGPKHPLAIPRVSTTLDLIAALGWLDPARYIDSPRATVAELTRFHTPDYIAALQRAEATQQVAPADRDRHRIGADGNPVYREIFSRPATSAGGVLHACRLTAQTPASSMSPAVAPITACPTAPRAFATSMTPHSASSPGSMPG